MITVGEVMSAKVITLKASDSLAAARELMKKEHIRHIPIVDEHCFPVGIITQRDILKVQASVLEENNRQIVDENQVFLEQIMTRKLAYVTPQDALRSAGLKIQKKKCGCLPVMENNQLVGIITDSDFVGVAIDLIEQMDYKDDF